MAVQTEEHVEIQGGFDKQIEHSAMGMMLDVLQKYQYQFPIKSAVRELVSNGLDAISEREVAKSILNGSHTVQEYFVDKDGEVYQDSKFDKDYYNPKHLSDDQVVHILYVEGKGIDKDYIQIEDNGVGLGGRRLEKYFSLGYSSKRLNTFSRGRFGLGNKSPLSIMPYYTVENRYNGKLYRFNVYSGKVESFIPKYDLEGNKENIEHKFSNGYALYCEPTDKPNGVTITIEAKKHHRQQYIDAVRSQLLYFDNVEMIVRKENGYNEIIDYKADIFYEDEQIILSDNSYWSKPHLLIDKVNYGFINFDELELEQKYGNIGIKVAPELVSINPSRESIVWDDVTKKMILERFQNVVKTATKFVQDELKENDFIKWLRICYQISSRYQAGGDDTVISRLAGIIDISQVQPFFPMNKSIRFSPTTIMNGLQCRMVTLKVAKEAGKNVTKVNREELKYGIGLFIHLPIILIDDRSSARKDKFLLSTTANSGFITIKIPFWLQEGFDSRDFQEEFVKLYGFESSKKADSIRESAEAIWEFVKKSADVIWYDKIEVPENFKGTDSDEDEEAFTEEDLQEAETQKLTHEERRKAQGKTVVHTPRLIHSFKDRQPSDYVHNLYEWQKMEIPIYEINSWKEEEIYYGNDADAEMIKFASFISRLPAVGVTSAGREQTSVGSWQTAKLPDTKLREYGVSRFEAFRCPLFFDRTDIKIIKVANNNNRLYSDFKPIQKFFLDVQNNKITMSDTLIKWNTARQIKERLSKLNFLFRFPFDSKKQAQYHKIVAYVKANYREVGEYVNGSGNMHGITLAAYTDLLTHLDKVQQFQLFVAQCEDPLQIAELAKEIWNNPKINNGYALDTDLWKEFEDLLDWSEPVHLLLNELPVLTGIEPTTDRSELKDFDQFGSREDTYHLSQEVEQEISNFLRYKNVI